MLRGESDYFYIGLDPAGSPIVVLNTVGSVVKQLSYDPLGAQIADSAPDFPFPFGYRCGYADPTTRFVIFRSHSGENKVYDPRLGRWTAPSYGIFLRDSRQLALKPELGNLYRAAPVWTAVTEYSTPMTGRPRLFGISHTNGR